MASSADREEFYTALGFAPGTVCRFCPRLAELADYAIELNQALGAYGLDLYTMGEDALSPKSIPGLGTTAQQTLLAAKVAFHSVRIWQVGCPLRDVQFRQHQNPNFACESTIAKLNDTGIDDRSRGNNLG